MLNHFVNDAEHIYLALGATDFRKQIHSLVALVQLSFGKDPFEEAAVFLFCNKRKDSIKVLRFDRNGFVLAQKKLLEEKEQIIAAQQEKLSQQEEQIRKQQIQLENMMQALLHARKKIFGSSSEKTQVEGQMHLFMTQQELAVELLKQQKEISVKAHKKIWGTGRNALRFTSRSGRICKRKTGIGWVWCYPGQTWPTGPFVAARNGFFPFTKEST